LTLKKYLININYIQINLLNIIMSNDKINESDLFMKYKSSYKLAFIDMTTHIFLLSIGFYLLYIFKNSWVNILPIIFVGLLNVKTFIIFHDCCHNSYTPNKNLNYIISHITGIFIFVSPNWILDHHTHHLSNGNYENKYKYKFNELIEYTENQFLKLPKIKRNIFILLYNYKVYFTLFPFLYFFLVQRYVYIFKKIKYGNKIIYPLITIIFNHIINNIGIIIYIYTISYYHNIVQCLFSLYIACIIGFILFHNQHTFNPSFVINNDEWTQKNSGLLGSSFLQIPKYLKYFTGGIEYHHIHHINAKIPGYNLKKYHDEVILKSHIFDDVVKLSWKDCLNNLKLRLYSESSCKYIRIDEIKNK